ncbi:MAG: hypothetical protein NTU79_07620 [Planctomycetota bacterium]|nr:hypothetical protein [Planctomycetota bacterium]
MGRLLTSVHPRPTQIHSSFGMLDALAGNESAQSAVNELLFIAADKDLQRSLVEQLDPLLSKFPKLQRGLQPLKQFVNNTRVPSSFLVFLDRDRDALPSLLQILSIESSAVDWLVADPDSFDWLRLSAGQSVDREHLRDTLISEIKHLDEEAQVLASLNRFRKRETLRVLCAICLHEMPFDVASQQFAWIADAGVAAAFVAANAERKNDRRHRSSHQNPAIDVTEYLCVLGVGAIGGQELDLDSTLDLVLLIDSEQFQDESRIPFQIDEVQRLSERAIELLQHPDGLSYCVAIPFNDLSGNDTRTVQIQDYRRWIRSVENHGRTWVRLALMKSRYLFGNTSLAHRLLEEFPGLIYRRYLTRADIAGIGALKRKIDRDGKELENAPTVETAVSMELLNGWKREIEFLVQFLQLINGGELESIRIGNTVEAIEALAQTGCLTEQERSILVVAYYRFYQSIVAYQMQQPLRNPEGSAGPLDHVDKPQVLPFNNDVLESWSKVKQIRDHLRGEVFADENQAPEETDLILDPNPKPEWVEKVLEKFGFKHKNEATRFLRELAQEEVTMLSTRRCRHFLSIIAKQLLMKISQTPDPDLTLENLAVSCRSLGGKGILWELFSVHEPSLDLYIRLCGASPYLIGILTSNPGMIDELLDSLMLNRLPTEQQLGVMLHELCRGADDIEPIVHSFKNARYLNVGVRDILGKESITDTHRALSDIADVCFQQIVDSQHARLVKRFGVPTTSDGVQCRFGIVALGKLGAREPNYHSDISLLLMYDSDGTTRPLGATRHHEPISSEYFFHQLAQKIAQTANRVGRAGRLYETKNWIVSPNRNTMLAWQVNEFQRFLTEASDLALQRQQLCSARCILGQPAFQQTIHAAMMSIVRDRPWSDEDNHASLKARLELETSAGSRNLKRGEGGTLDVEYIAQLLLLRHVANKPEIFVAGTIEAIDRLRLAGLIETKDADDLREGYNFLRGVESGLRLMNTLARHDLPSSEMELSRLAYVLKLDSASELERQCNRFRSQNRVLFKKYL